MFGKFALMAFLQAVLIQGFSAQCFGAYNGLAAEGWPTSSALAWEGNMAWPAGKAFAWEASSPCAGSAYATAYAADSIPWAAAPYTAAEFGARYSPASLAGSNGGGLAISSASPIAPTGVSMNSENIYEGPLAVSGAMPFLGAVAFEGALPTGGAGAVTYGCGNGNVAMLNEDYNSGYGIGALPYAASIPGPVSSYNALAGPAAVEAGVARTAFGYNNIGTRVGGCGCGGVF